MTPQLEIILIACTVSVACVLPGVFLVLRGIALMSDAISHAVLLGIVLSFFVWVFTWEYLAYYPINTKNNWEK